MCNLKMYQDSSLQDCFFRVLNTQEQTTTSTTYSFLQSPVCSVWCHSHEGIWLEDNIAAQRNRPLTGLFSLSACKKKKFGNETSILLSLIKRLKFSAEWSGELHMQAVSTPPFTLFNTCSLPVTVLVMTEPCHLALQLHPSASMCTSQHVFQECITWNLILSFN